MSHCDLCAWYMLPTMCWRRLRAVVALKPRFGEQSLESSQYIWHRFIHLNHPKPGASFDECIIKCVIYKVLDECIIVEGLGAHRSQGTSFGQVFKWSQLLRLGLPGFNMTWFTQTMILFGRTIQNSAHPPMSGIKGLGFGSKGSLNHLNSSQ